MDGSNPLPVLPRRTLRQWLHVRWVKRTARRADRTFRRVIEQVPPPMAEEIGHLILLRETANGPTPRGEGNGGSILGLVAKAGEAAKRPAASEKLGKGDG